MAHDWTGLEPSEYDQGQRDGVYEVLSVSTAGALIRRDIFEELGGFDKNLELFRDDVDFGWRVRVAGNSVIAVTDAIGYHAQAASTERRSIDVKGALLHRPLLLDRQNAAFVLLANSSIWLLPLLSLQLLSGALIRAFGYLFAKLPGYASDELLAVASLIIHPAELISARRVRKKHKLISSRVVQQFIPSRFAQLRSAVARTIESLRTRFFSEQQNESPALSDLTINDDEDLLTPVSHQSWKTIFSRPLVVAATLITAVSVVWTRHRLGTISGGALAQSPHNFQQLLKLYLASWHEIGMGSGLSSPPWIFILLVASIATLGNVALLVTLIFLAAPYILLFTSHRYLSRLTENRWLSGGAALLYALSPISLAAINSGRLGVLVFLASLPSFVSSMRNWVNIESRSWRSIFALSLFTWVLFAFNPSVMLILGFIVLFALAKDYLSLSRNHKDPLFIERLKRRMTHHCYSTLTFCSQLFWSLHSSNEILERNRLYGRRRWAKLRNRLKPRRTRISSMVVREPSHRNSSRHFLFNDCGSSILHDWSHLLVIRNPRKRTCCQRKWIRISYKSICWNIPGNFYTLLYYCSGSDV
jgi:hypothetical protein